MICQVTEFEEHIQELLAKYDVSRENVTEIHKVNDSPEGWAEVKFRNIGIWPNTDTEGAYWTALHEIGHCVDPRGIALDKEIFPHPFSVNTAKIVEVECVAWEWAMKNSRFPMSEHEEKIMYSRLNEYMKAYPESQTTHPLAIKAKQMSTVTNPDTTMVSKITSGELDGQLDMMMAAINLRKAMLGKPTQSFMPPVVQRPQSKSVYEFQIGDRVRFNKEANPKYLIGTEATVTGRRRTKVTIKLDAAAGRFRGDKIVCPTSIIDKV